MNPIIFRKGIGRLRVSEASLERLRKFLLPLELAEAELKAKPAAAVMVILRDGPRGLEVLLGERTKREGDPWSGQIGLPGGRHRDEDPTILGELRVPAFTYEARLIWGFTYRILEELLIFVGLSA